MFVSVLGLSVVVVGMAPICLGLGLTQGSEVVRPFGPTGRWTGHFGVDLAADGGSRVRAVGDGFVSFVGRINGRLSVTVLHGGAVRSSYSYLGSASVSRHQAVARGDPVGTAGIHGGVGSFHLSLRIGSRYVDPIASFACDAVPERGLSLAAAPTTYAVARVRNPRRYVRSSPRGPPGSRAHSV
jgi:murein DD-endopeptidase MepM/ murein hydrolase activator NlpD